MNLIRVLSLTLLFMPGAQAGTVYFLDPVNGKLANDGSKEHPWPGLQAVIVAKKIQAKNAQGSLVNPAGVIRDGDRLWLRSGYHGEVVLKGYYLEQGITVEAQPGQLPKLRRIQLDGGSHWTFSGLDISPAHDPVYVKTTIVSSANNDAFGRNSFITIRNCRISSVSNIAGWVTAKDWLDRACNGISLSGSDNRVISNTVRNVACGIMLSGERGYAGRNLVENFCGDGMRVMNHNCVAEYNLVRNAYQVDDNHMDGIQGFYFAKPGKELRGVVIRGNTIIRHENPQAILASPYLQGIGFFDGPFTDCVFENNLVMADSNHGISVYNATRCRIENNTVVGDGVSGMKNPGRIMLGYKSHRPGELRENILRNNLSDLLSVGTQATNTISEHNLLLSGAASREKVFADAAKHDFHLRSGSPAIDAGSAVGGPATDIEGTKRPQGTGVDLGAYEYHGH